MSGAIGSRLVHFGRGERGKGVVWLALALPVLIGFVGLTVDGGRLYLSRQRVVNVLDSATLAGGGYLLGYATEPEVVRQAVLGALEANVKSADSEWTVMVNDALLPHNPDILIAGYNDTPATNTALTEPVIWRLDDDSPINSDNPPTYAPRPGHALQVRGRTVSRASFMAVLGFNASTVPGAATVLLIDPCDVLARGSDDNNGGGGPGGGRGLGIEPPPLDPSCIVGTTVLLLDEDAIDTDISSIENAARRHRVSSAHLVNDDLKTEHGNPWLRWSEFYHGDLVLIPTGQIADEGAFRLPSVLPWPREDFVLGLVPQSRLDKILGVKPLHADDLALLIGQTVVAVVYDSDISINYNPLNANLQGERRGLLAFRVEGLVSRGGLPESRSSSSLPDLRVTILPAMDPEELTDGVKDGLPDPVLRLVR